MFLFLGGLGLGCMFMHEDLGFIQIARSLGQFCASFRFDFCTTCFESGLEDLRPVYPKPPICPYNITSP